MLDYRGVGLARFHCNTINNIHTYVRILDIAVHSICTYVCVEQGYHHWCMIEVLFYS